MYVFCYVDIFQGIQYHPKIRVSNLARVSPIASLTGGLYLAVLMNNHYLQAFSFHKCVYLWFMSKDERTTQHVLVNLFEYTYSKGVGYIQPLSANIWHAIRYIIQIDTLIVSIYAGKLPLIFGKLWCEWPRYPFTSKCELIFCLQNLS